MGEEIQGLLDFATSRDPSERPRASEFADGLIALTRPPVTVESSADPAQRARTVFRVQASANKRLRDLDSTFRTICTDTSQAFIGQWAKVTDEIGWEQPIISGGASGRRTTELAAEGWVLGLRKFGKGPLGNRECQLVCTIFHAPYGVIRRLHVKVMMSIEFPGAPQHEFVAAERDFESFAGGPELDRMLADVTAFAGSAEPQFRAIEHLRVLLEAPEGQLA